MVTVRPAGEQDSLDLLAWRNDPVTRAASIESHPVSRAAHEAWFARVLADPHRVLYIGYDSGTSIGMVRFDAAEDGRGAEISLNVAPAQRGRGLGRELLLAAISRYREAVGPPKMLRARIRPGNEASLRLFRGAGFSTLGGSGDMIELLLRDTALIRSEGPS
jgi:L-amino acid N-acyltransferase YncA